MMTGEPASVTGIGNIIPTDSEEALDLSFSTLAEDLSNVGYSCHLNGKWHLASYSKNQTHGPVQQGFDSWIGVHEWFSTLPEQPSWYSFDTVYEVAGSAPVYGHVSRHEHITQWQVDEAINRLTETEGPWFYTLSLYAPHPPLEEDPPGFPTDGSEQSVYEALIRHMDQEIGRLGWFITQNHPDTTVVFVSDNGPPKAVSGVPGKGKGNLEEIGTHAPLAITGPGLPQGAVDTRLAQPEDVWNTILTLGGVDTASADSFDLLGSEERQLSSVERFIPNGVGVTRDKHAAAAWTGDYVLLRGYAGFNTQWVPDPEKFYNLSLDPQQLVPLEQPYTGPELSAYTILDEYL